MSLVLVTVGLLFATGLLGALLLYFVAKRFHVDEDPRVESIAAVLPGANCGGCGFKGCHDFAAQCAGCSSLSGIYCPVGGDKVMAEIAKIVGLDVAASTPMVATLRCNGSNGARNQIAEYRGPQSCAVQASLAIGRRGCPSGCLGCGDCVEACTFGAIAIDHAMGLPTVDEDMCTACGQCVKSCPRKLLQLRPKGPRGRRVWVACSNCERGAVARKACSAACIGCGKCARTCPFGAITVENNLANIDFAVCKACGKCVGVCPTGAILSHNISQINKPSE
jgi:Na+-translocating ferredoxin:NAD+ oxidoreductase RNF subunit RnfB